MSPAVPIATYRLQLSSAFGFDDATKLVPYLKSLGISHLYASPFLKARAGSTHGYDIIDHGQLNPEFGGEAGFARLSAALAQADIGLILDFVPNHMGVGGADNAWWLDVLEWGPKSPHAASFDIDWDTLPYRREGGVLLPILGRAYGDALESGEIVLRYDAQEGSFSAWYYEHRLPIRPDRYGEMLRTIVGHAGAGEEAAGRRLLELAAHASPSARALARAGAGLQGGPCRRSRRGRIDRARHWRLPSRSGRSRERGRAPSVARTATLSPGALARCRQRDQLSPLLRHQRPGRAARGRFHIPSGWCTSWWLG